MVKKIIPKKILPKLKVKSKRPGAPAKPKEDIKRPDGLTNGMYERALREVDVQNLGSFAALNRRVWEWYFTALDTQRGDSDAHELFDDIVIKENKLSKEKEK